MPKGLPRPNIPSPHYDDAGCGPYLSAIIIFLIFAGILLMVTAQ